MKAYKFLLFQDGKIVSKRDRHEWEIGEWYSVNWKVEAGDNGFHASKKPLDALSYVNGNVLAIVEYRGDIDEHRYKFASRDMRIVRAYHWNKEDNIAMQVYCASLVLPIFEKAYPDDDRIRNCIAVKRRHGAGKTTKEELGAAREAARAAAKDATSKASFAASAAAVAAAWAAASAAVKATPDNTTEKKINTWMVRRMNTKLKRI